ncbi:hypothetical protein LCGC14_0823320 [marine sediment metagenome]|uniref:Uncharacterized protein n=1 Tax=marine sediment metagenome TaxID=412755 RepID=A0A0F9SQQ5_9ZZZZ|nr:hypothetical protein [Candidatus Scalindua sp.]
MENLIKGVCKLGKLVSKYIPRIVSIDDVSRACIIDGYLITEDTTLIEIMDNSTKDNIYRMGMVYQKLGINKSLREHGLKPYFRSI